jgi:hypothetical protein
MKVRAKIALVFPGRIVQPVLLQAKGQVKGGAQCFPQTQQRVTDGNDS